MDGIGAGMIPSLYILSRPIIQSVVFGGISAYPATLKHYQAIASFGTKYNTIIYIARYIVLNVTWHLVVNLVLVALPGPTYFESKPYY